MKRILPILTVTIFLFKNGTYSQQVEYRNDNVIKIKIDRYESDIKRYCGVYRKINGIDQRVGIIKIIHTDNIILDSKIIREYRPYKIRNNDFIDYELDSIYTDFFPINYRTISLSTNDDKIHSDIRLDYSPWFMNWILVSVRGLIGNTRPDFSEFLLGFSTGIGGTINYKRVNLNNTIFYNRVYDPNLRRREYKSLGDDLISYNIDLNIRVYRKYFVSVEYELYLNDKYEKHSLKPGHVSVGFKIGLNKMSNHRVESTP